MNKYKELRDQHKKSLRDFKIRYNNISAFRLIIAIGFGAAFYWYYKTEDPLLFLPLLLLPIAFLIAMKAHQKVAWAIRFHKALIQINKNELTYLKNESIPFENGLNFTDPTHPYSYDLDIFGEHSLYQNLNRTATYMGGEKLASLLQSSLPIEKITRHQEAVKELTSKVEWRQELEAIAQIKPDTKESWQKLIDWTKSSNPGIPVLLNIASYISPVVVFICIALYFLTPMSIFGNISLILIILNLGLLATQLRKIKRESIKSGEIDKILKQYSLIIERIENQTFDSEFLKHQQQQLAFEGRKVSQKIRELSTLFTRMDHIDNAYAGPVFNGLFLFHIHVLRDLYQWKKVCGEQIGEWLAVIGEFESLNSLANFSFNNPDYIFPNLNKNREIQFQELGHPLISSEKRINNDVSFNPHPFFILTGSNMSGKSTFLRTLGVNMVLANIGSVVCAKQANVHPLPVLVSMRLSDSLSDSESYFFAEVKRLKEIMDTLETASCFVLLDEILRGTNSDDKRSGTIEVIKKMVERNVIGAIATHDLEVCNTTDEYPDALSNKRFEVEIIDDELVFDYKLRDGICQNKSATFLMKKMGVI
ncbi:MAG: DNA mismatch repair protein [Cyclobacteriaceae bacterium]